jgi:hypothetical protein
MLPVLLYLAFTNPGLVAQAATEIGPWLTALNLGLAGIGLWAFTTGKIVAHGTHAKCVEKLDAAEAELRRRADEDRSSLIPVLTRATDVLAKHLERRMDNTPNPPNKQGL